MPVSSALVAPAPSNFVALESAAAAARAAAAAFRAADAAGRAAAAAAGAAAAAARVVAAAFGPPRVDGAAVSWFPRGQLV